MPGVAVAVPQSTAAAGLTPADLWRIMRANWLVILLVTVLSTAAAYGAFMLCLRYLPSYTVQGIIQCNRATDPIVLRNMNQSFGDNSPIEIELRTHARALMAEDLWNKVLTDSTVLRNTNWFNKFVQMNQSRADLSPAVLARQDLKDRFKASPATGTRVIIVTFDSSFPDDARVVVEEIVQAYIVKAQTASSEKLNSQNENLKRLIRTYQIQLDTVRSHYNDIAVTLNADGVTGMTHNMSVKEIEIHDLTNTKLKVEEERNRAKGLFESLQAALKEGRDPPEVNIAVDNNQMITFYKSQFAQADMEYKTGLINQLEGSQRMKEIIARLDYLKSQQAEKEAEVRTNARAAIMESARRDYESKESELKSYLDRIESLKSEMATMANNFSEFIEAKDRVDGLNAVVSELQDRQMLLQNSIAKDPTVSWISHPLPPDAPTFPDRKIFLAAGAAIGLLLSLGLAFARELLDTSVRSPRDLQRVGPMNLLGMIPADSDDPESNGTPLHLAISVAPHSIIAEQFRQVRTRLQHAASLDTTRSIVVTSPAPGDGKSFVACNLAAGLALNGRRILLVDANFRRAELHRLFGVSNDMGFSNVLESIGNLESAVQKTAVPNLELLTTGPRPANPTELIESQLFSDFIDRALEEYDHVIFDTGPLLVVSEAVALAPRVDGVITVVRTKANSRGMLTRVRDTLKQIKAEHLGVVLNRVETWGGGYYGRNIRTYYEYQNNSN